MSDSRIGELVQKVEKLAKELVKTDKENKRLNRLLGVAEIKIKKLSKTGAPDGNGILQLSQQLDKMKSERKIIKTKVEKMASKLARFYKV